MLITHLTAAACAAAAICLGRSEYEKKLYPPKKPLFTAVKYQKNALLSFCPTCMKIPLDRKMKS